MQRTEGDRQRRQHVADVSSGHRPRLLPWTAEDGKRCWLSTDDDSGFLSRLADDLEAVQLAMGAEVLEHARILLHDLKATTDELRYAGARLAECLSDVLRVAESRGMRAAPADVKAAETTFPTPTEADG